MAYNWAPLLLSIKLAVVTTLFLFVISLPISYWLAYSAKKSKALVESIVSLPLVLPPSVLGFYLLLAFSPKHAFGGFIEKLFDKRLVFSFEGLVLASIIYSLPFMIHPIQAGFQNLPQSLREVSYTLGISKIKTFFYVLLPNIKPALLTGVVLSFAHSIGEFGVVLMIGGNIPGVTKVASIAVYDEVESLQYENAHFYAFILILVSFSILFILFRVNKGLQKSIIS